MNHRPPTDRSRLCAIPAALITAAFASSLLAAEPDLLERRYEAGVADAAVATEAEIATDLVAITPDNGSLIWNEDKTRLLVVTWKSEGAFKNFIEGHQATSPSEDYVIWVTAAPKMQERCQAWVNAHPDAGEAGLNLYLKQFLGLNPSWSYDVFVELWVAPQDLFRPCVDPDPSDRTCALQFGNDNPQVKGIADYRAFYENLYFKSFRYPPGVPWTGLGYTLNWGGDLSVPLADQGASEFIISPGSPYTIAGATPTAEYCAPKP